MREMQRTDYILNEDFLDTVFKHMYNLRGTYGSSYTISNEISKSEKLDLAYNDVLMALEQLERDGYLNLEKKEREGLPVYRLTYYGFLTFKSDKSGRPYHNFIKEKIWNKRTNIFKTIVIATNAIAILIITGSQVYFDQKDTELASKLVSTMTELEKTRIENINLKFKIKNKLNIDTLNKE